MRFHPSSLCTALSFLTRLWPSRLPEPEDFPKALPWFPLAGLVIGVLAVFPGWLGLFSSHPFVLGWLTACLSLWITRGLHADGLADIADAWGSNASGERFWNILKDSRTGPFGALGLVAVFSGQALAFGSLWSLGRPGAIVWCFMLGRMTSVAALRLCRERVRPGLSALFAPGATNGVTAAALACTLFFGCALAPVATLFWGVALSSLLLAGLTRLSVRQQGFNGDFMGAAILLGELAGALGALL